MVTEYEILQRLNLYPMPEDEERLWRMTTEMNTLGVRVDAALIEGALTIHEQSARELTDEAVRITGLTNPNSTAQLKAWLEEMLSDWRETDVQLEGLRKEGCFQSPGDRRSSGRSAAGSWRSVSSWERHRSRNM